MKITIVGGGNLGSLLASKFSLKHEIVLYTSNPEQYDKHIKVYKDDTPFYYEGNISFITDKLEEAVKDAEWIFITYPSILFKDFSKKLIPLLHKGQHIVAIPGSGAFELFFKEAIKKECTISGLQRVHAVSRIIEKGKSVRESGVRGLLKVASIPASFNKEASSVLQNLYEIPVEPIENYLNITLINSNSILHTSRLYSIFKNYMPGELLKDVPLFYEDWDIDSSKLLIQMDKELFEILTCLEKDGIVVNKILPILDHYESFDAQSLTKKIKSIQSFKGLMTPIKKTKSGIEPNFDSRYFTADFPLGLDVIVAFADLCELSCDTLRKVSNWYHNIVNNEKSFSLQEFNIYTKADLKKLYLEKM